MKRSEQPWLSPICFLFYIFIQLVLNRDNWSKGPCCESDLYSFIIMSELRFNWLEGIPRKVTKWKSDKVIKWIISENWKVKSESAYSAKSLNWWVLFLIWNQNSKDQLASNLNLLDKLILKLLELTSCLNSNLVQLVLSQIVKT